MCNCVTLGIEQMQFKITTKIYLGFGMVLLLASIAAGVGTLSLIETSDVFTKYRTLARQTNADGRIQANMLMTRIFAKNFVIEANPENIEGVQQRAERTLEMIEFARSLTGESTARQLLINDLEEDLTTYVEQFAEVTNWQSERNDLVHNQLNVLGPQTEQALTEIMTSAVGDGDTLAAYEAGVTLRSLMLARLYANRFLIQNDDASADRALREFRDMELNIERLLSHLENPTRRELAEEAKELQRQYLDAFLSVRRVIQERNTIIQYQLDRIGPEVADRIERLKLAVAEEQDRIGGEAQRHIYQAEFITLGASGAAIVLGLLVAGMIGRGVSRPIQDLTGAATEIANGRFDQEIDATRNDEIGTLAKAFVAMRGAIDEKVNSLRAEVEERTRAEKDLAIAQEELKRTNESLEETVRLRTEELAQKEEDLRLALLNMSDGIYTVDADMNIRTVNDRYYELTGLSEEFVAPGKPLIDALIEAAERGYFGEGNPRDLAENRMKAIQRPGYVEHEVVTMEGRTLHLRKSDIPGGGAVVVLSDVTENRKAQKDLSRAFDNISSSIDYASRIQHATLPNTGSTANRLKDFSVYWEPRDVVGGDLYWCRPWGGGELIMLGDCTGHGVPGAFMTLIATSALDRAMMECDPGDLAALITRMHALIQDALDQETGANGGDDGLDLGACFWDRETGKLQFVGAHFDLLILENGEVRKIKGGRKGLGYREISADYAYEVSTVDYSDAARFYLVTDGVIDQIGGEPVQRFGRKRLLSHLTASNDRSLSEQVSSIQVAVKAHQGGSPRVDDMAILGFSLG